MKAALFDGKEINVKEVAIPEPTDSQVLIRIKAAGICGTDLAIVRGHLPTPVPIIPGHEFAGEVVRVGKLVEQTWVGKRVTSEINTNIDHECYYCERKYLINACLERP